jgi:hypothetical protein
MDLSFAGMEAVSGPARPVEGAAGLFSREGNDSLHRGARSVEGLCEREQEKPGDGFS